MLSLRDAFLETEGLLQMDYCNSLLMTVFTLHIIYISSENGVPLGYRGTSVHYPVFCKYVLICATMAYETVEKYTADIRYIAHTVFLTEASNLYKVAQ